MSATNDSLTEEEYMKKVDRILAVVKETVAPLFNAAEHKDDLFDVVNILINHSFNKATNIFGVLPAHALISQAVANMMIAHNEQFETAQTPESVDEAISASDGEEQSEAGAK